MADGPSTPTKGKRKASGAETDAQKGTFRSSTSLISDLNSPTACICMTEEANKTFNALLKTELFGPDSIDSSVYNSPSSRGNSASFSVTGTSLAASPSTPSSRALFSFASPSRKRIAPGERERVIGGAQGLDSPTHERYSVSPVRYESQKLLLSPRKATRQLSKVPFKVLDAPDLAVSFLSLFLSIAPLRETDTR